MGAGVSADNPKGGKVQLYRALKEEFTNLAEVGDEDAAAAELAERLGCSEELLFGIFRSASPAKLKQPPQAAAAAAQELESESETTPKSPSPAVTTTTTTSLASQSKKIVKSLAHSSYPNFICGLDGSAASMLCFETAMKLRKTKGRLVGFNIEDATKVDLPAKFKWGAISSSVEVTLATSIPPELYRLESVLKVESDTTKQGERVLRASL